MAIEARNVTGIRMMRLADIIPYENNPRDNADAVGPTAESIREFGFNQPIAVDKDNVIICGHTRLMAAKLLGLEEVPVVVADWLTPEQAKAYRITDNKTGEKSSWNIEKLVGELKELEESGYDTKETGFDTTEIERMMAETDPVAEGETDPDQVPEVEEEPRSQRGAVYRLGSNRVMCGDSTEMNDVRRLVGDREADLWLTDPPYNVDYHGGNGKTIKNDNQTEEAFLEFLNRAYANAALVMRPGAPFYIWHASTQAENFIKALKNKDLHFAQVLLWVKNSLILGHSDYHWRHEPCLYGWKEGKQRTWISDRKQTTAIELKGSPFTRQADGSYTFAVNGRIYRIAADAVAEELTTDILRFDKPQKSTDHPTMKPTALLIYLLKNSSYRNAWVLDSFCGSGSSIIACEQTSRNCLAMEYDRHYCDIIRKRWAEFVAGEGCDWERLTPETE